MRLAAKSRISAFDSDAGAVTALQKAATSTSGLKPVKAETRDLFRRPLMPQELRDYDAVVFDPPRQGAQAQAQQLAASKVPVVVAVSCNVATFARDARILIDGGYRIEGVTPVDQFRHTPHVELVARFDALTLSVALPFPAASCQIFSPIRQDTRGSLFGHRDDPALRACGRRLRAPAWCGSPP